MSVALTLLFYVVVFGALSWVSFLEWRAATARRRRDAARLPRIPMDPPRINTVRRDPSPKPRRPAA